MQRTRRKFPWGWPPATRRSLAVLAILLSATSYLNRQSEGPPTPPGPPTLRIDPNTVPPAVLAALPKLGPVLAGRLIDARERAPFSSIGDLQDRVKGIGPATAIAIRPYLRFRNDPPPAPAVGVPP